MGGLFNIVFSQPGTSLIELHCIGNANVRMSFIDIARKIGMR